MKTSSTLLEDIYESAFKFLQPAPLKERYRIAVEEATRLAKADHGTIFLNKDNELIRVYTNVPNSMKVQPRKQGNAHQTLVDSRLRVVQVDDEFAKIHPKLYKGGARSLILIPLTYEKKRIGVLSLQSSEKKHFTPVKIRTLNLFGSFLGLAIVNSQLYEETQDALHARDLFISLASHELKTPLTTIMAYSDLIEKKLSLSQVPSAKSVEVMRGEIKRLKNMLDEFLAIDQIKSGQFRYVWRRVNILDVVKKSIINFKLSNPGYKVIVENSIPQNARMLTADSEKLQQVITNLLNNSAKFSSSLTPILVMLEEARDFISIFITDFGKGIKKKEQDKVFKEFFKGSLNKNGMGIGLYLVKNIIEDHQGKIELSSKINKGTTIMLNLPKKRYEP